MAAHLKYKSGNSWVDYNLVVYPVGALYISYSSTSPASLFGGTWTPITGRFPYFNAGTAPGGSNTTTLSIANMPAHVHQMKIKGAWEENHAYGLTSSGPGFGGRPIINNGGSGDWGKLNTGTSSFMQSVGSGSSFNNMPAYQTFYAWRRTA